MEYVLPTAALTPIQVWRRLSLLQQWGACAWNRAAGSPMEDYPRYRDMTPYMSSGLRGVGRSGMVRLLRCDFDWILPSPQDESHSRR